LPESNEATLLANQIHTALESRNYRLAIDLTEQMRGLPDSLAAASAARTYYPIARQASLMLESFPPEALRVYRGLFDPEVETRFREASAEGDLATLEELFWRYPVASARSDIGRALAVRLLDQDRPVQALEVLRELPVHSSGVGPADAALQVIALARTGAYHAADALLRRLANEVEAAQGTEWSRRVRGLQDWLASERAATAGGGGSGGSLAPTLGAPSAWDRELPPLGNRPPLGQDAVTSAAALLRRLPVYRPVVDGETLVVRCQGTMHAIDTVSLTLRWRVREIQAVEAQRRSEDEVGVRVIGLPFALEELSEAPPLEASELFVDALAHRVVAGRGLVFSVEALRTDERTPAAIGRVIFGNDGDVRYFNELIARDVATGRQVWRAGHEPDSPLFGVAFQDVPLVLGEHLVAAVLRTDALHLCVLAVDDGHLERDFPLVGAPLYLPPTGGTVQLAADEASIYVATGNGVVAALRRDRLLPADDAGVTPAQGRSAWRWASLYSSDAAARRALVEFPPRSPWREYSAEPPVLAEELLIVAPPDAAQVIAFDRFTGEQRWQIPRRRIEFIVGAAAAGLVVGGQSLECLALADGQKLLWRSVPLDVTGRPALCGQRLFVPTATGIVTIDPRTGKLLEEQGDARESDTPVARNAALVQEPGANLVATGEALFAVTPWRISKLLDPTAARRSYEPGLADSARAPASTLGLAWADVLEGDYIAALERLESLAPKDAALAAARDRLLTEVLVGLSRRASGAEGLAWLQRAHQVARAPAAQAQLDLLLGDALEAAGRPEEALQHFRDVILDEHGGRVDPDGRAERTVAVWVLAGRRLHDLLDRVSPEAAGRFRDELSKLADDGAVSDSALRHLRSEFVADPLGPVLARALCQRRLPPEELVNYLPREDDAGWPRAVRRRIHLARWETHVALGMLTEAESDREYWARNLAEADLDGAVAAPATQAAAEAENAELAREVRRLEQAMRKLAQAAGPPLQSDAPLRRQWRLADTELIVDLRRPARSARPWVLARSHERARIQLCSVDLSGLSLRETRDSLTHGPAVEQAAQEGLDRVVSPRIIVGQAQERLAWPAVIHGWRAAVGVAGGLVCVGLGPERGGGERLWEHELREWPEVPRDFERRVVGCAEGVCVLTTDARLRMIDWNDGSLLWERTEHQGRIEQIVGGDGRLFLATSDGSVRVLEAETGNELGSLAPDPGRAHAIDLVAETLIVWYPAKIVGLDPATLETRWQKQETTGGAQHELPERGWVAYFDEGAAAWRLLDARRGEEILAWPELVGWTLEAIAAEGNTVFVAATRVLDSEGNEGEVSHVLMAYDVGERREVWSTSYMSAVPVNETQLTAVDGAIPVLICKPPAGGFDEPEEIPISLWWIDKSSGPVAQPQRVGGRARAQLTYEDRQVACGVYLLATASKLLVQADGEVTAYGTSAAGDRP